MKLKFTFLFVLLPFLLISQADSSKWKKLLENYKIKAVIGIQLWSTYSFGQEVYDEEREAFQPVDDRLNFQIRRTRFGISGQPYDNLKFSLVGALDFVGRDVLSAPVGGANNGNLPGFGIWDATIQWRIKSNSEAFNMVVGYFPLQIGRESISSAFRSSTMEKAWSQNYLRRHLTGKGPGRASGVNVGGLFQIKEANVIIGYDGGVFTPVFPAFDGNSTGSEFSPLYVGRVAFYFGDPEFTSYTMGHKSNFFGERNGLTLAIAGARQGETDLFSGNRAAGMDFLLNLGNLNLDGEWTILKRDGQRSTDDQIQSFTASANTGFVRLSYNVPLKNKTILEPVLMLMQYNGPLEGEEQTNADWVAMPYGKDRMIDLGVNVYPNPNLKLSFHYTQSDGASGDIGDEAGINNHFFQGGVGAIRRGDWIGVGLVAIY